jgi:hypothetical protein
MVALLDALPAPTCTEPRYALAYDLILAETGRARESEALLNQVSADRLLPDELLLIEQAPASNRPPDRGSGPSLGARASLLIQFRLPN